MDFAQPNNDALHKKFLSSNRRHVLMITNHGIHEWEVIPGMRDTGGQNIFVNSMTHALSHHGFRITIANRGGYPHPQTGKERKGLDYASEYERILFTEDGRGEFVRKEDMNDQIPELVEYLSRFLKEEGTEVDLLVTHYWDAGKIGYMVKENLGFSSSHVWIPHSLGALKKSQVDSSRWEDLRIDERISEEKKILEKVDRVGYTSFDLKDSLQKDYSYSTDLFLPPSVDTNRYHPRNLPAGEKIWSFFDEHSPLSEEEIRKRKIITEISRTDTTKRKDVLVKAFASTLQKHPEALLILALDENREDIAGDIHRLIEEKGIEDSVILVGSVWDELPEIYSASCIYCTPSVMEGFGMSAQEAASTEIPVVASDLVPFVSEYLIGDSPKEVDIPGNQGKIKIGEGAVVVPADNVEGFSYALSYLLENDEIRKKMGEESYEITIPYFTWQRMIRDFLKALGFSLEGIERSA